MASRHGFDPARVHAFGYSNGANIAAAMLLTGAARFPRAVLVRAMAVLERKELEALPSLAGAEVLLAQGLYDPMGNARQTEALKELLEAAGARVEVRKQPAGHQITPGDVEAARAWLGGG
jgi:phospholipase/carboxylesterase